ncbi:hypothetical protein BJ875DRAFT_467057 [Amylocarpus encephaloides]|uniref:Secreted protein n=1 Tax=Amylocarpus encephaloides TaxID=45428 RepID=A0A9P8C3D4_9HELO|nr:hypothetical protein BJ875DRAFT_467057 [Amylocarpus encephaloides]
MCFTRFFLLCNIPSPFFLFSGSADQPNIANNPCNTISTHFVQQNVPHWPAPNPFPPASKETWQEVYKICQREVLVDP